MLNLFKFFIPRRFSRKLRWCKLCGDYIGDTLKEEMEHKC